MYPNTIPCDISAHILCLSISSLVCNSCIAVNLNPFDIDDNSHGLATS